MPASSSMPAGKCKTSSRWKPPQASMWTRTICSCRSTQPKFKSLCLNLYETPQFCFQFKAMWPSTHFLSLPRKAYKISTCCTCRRCANALSRTFNISGYGYQSSVARQKVIEEHGRRGLEYQISTQTFAPPVSKTFTMAQKLELHVNLRREMALTYCRNIAVLSEGKKQALHQRSKPAR